MKKSIPLLFVLVLVSGCASGPSLRQQLDAARAHRDAVIAEQVRKGNFSPSEGYEMLAEDHAHDMAFDGQMIASPYQEIETAPSHAPDQEPFDCPACNEDEEDSQTVPSGSGYEDIINSYARPTASPYGDGNGARGWDGRIYVPAGADPNPPPDFN